jgi:hypothetical protein
MIGTNAGTSSSSLSTTPSGSMYDLSMLGMGVTQVGGGSISGNRYRKRSKSRSTQGDYRMKLTADQKCEIASKEIDELREEMRKAAENAEKNSDSFKAVLEEADIRISEIKTEMREFDRDIAKGALNAQTRKIIAERLIKYFEDKLKERVHSFIH